MNEREQSKQRLVALQQHMAKAALEKGTRELTPEEEQDGLAYGRIASMEKRFDYKLEKESKERVRVEKEQAKLSAQMKDIQIKTAKADARFDQIDDDLKRFTLDMKNLFDAAVRAMHSRINLFLQSIGRRDL